MDAGGVPRITDFGLARDLNQEAAETSSGDLIGTPGYLPPEQVSARREQMGPRSDVYGLGAILYFLLTSRPPHLAGSLAEALRAVKEDEPVSPRQLNPSVPVDLDTVCLKCLQKDAESRYDSAADFADDLDRFVAGEPVRARRAGAFERLVKWRRRKPVVAALAGSLVLMFSVSFALVFWLWQREDRAYKELVRATKVDRALRDELEQKRREAFEASLAVQRAEFEAKSKTTEARLAHQTADNHLAALANARRELNDANGSVVRANDEVTQLKRQLDRLRTEADPVRQKELQERIAGAENKFAQAESNRAATIEVATQASAQWQQATSTQAMAQKALAAAQERVRASPLTTNQLERPFFWLRALSEQAGDLFRMNSRPSQ